MNVPGTANYRVTMTTPGVVRWWLLLVTMVTVVSVTAASGLQRGLVMNISTCECTVMNEVCSISEIADQNHSWPSEMSYPTAPLDLKVEVKESPDNTPTIDITWMPPKGANLPVLTGFFLDLRLPHSSFQLIQVFVPSFPPHNTQWRLTCTAKDVIYGQSLSVGTFSLPTPNKDDPYGIGLRVNVPRAENMKADNAYDWMPAVAVMTKGESIIVDFPFPQQFKDEIDKFQIKLEPPHRNLLVQEVPSNNAIHVKFDIPESLKSTCFTITIKKIRFDECLRSDEQGNCVTPEIIKTNGSLTDACDMTIIDEMTTTGKLISILPGTTTPWKVLGPPPDPESTNNLQLQLTVPLVVLTLVIIIIIIGTALYCRASRKINTGLNESSDDPESSDGSQENNNIKDCHALTLEPEEKHEIQLDDLKEKRVFIYYSDILPEHFHVVKNLAGYLMAECRCEVILDEWYQHEMNKAILKWHLKNFEEADKIIFIHSEDTKSKYKAYIRKDDKHQSCTRKPKGDTFSLMLSKVIMDNNDSKHTDNDKYLMVRFPYTPIKCLDYVQSKFCYALPHHLDEFVLHLHGLQRYEKERSNPNYIQGINAHDCAQTAAGRRLLEAVQKATDAVKRKPNWLQNAKEHAVKAEADSAAAAFSRTQYDDSSSTGSGAQDALGFFPPTSSEDIHSVIGDPGVLHQGRQSPSGASGYSMGEHVLSWHPEIGLYPPSSTDDISVTMDNVPASILQTAIPHPTLVDDMSPLRLQMSYHNNSLPMSGINQFYTEEEMPGQPPHGLQNVGIDPYDQMDSGFHSNEEASLLRVHQDMLRYTADPNGTCYRPQGEEVGLPPDLYPPESLSSGCSSLVDESFEQAAQGLPLEPREPLQYLQLPELGRSSV